jgi:ribonucleoside-diphosphate reductase alpha chain
MKIDDLKTGSSKHGNEKNEGNSSAKPRTGMTVKRVFTVKGVHPFDEITWEKRSANITNESGQVIFEQKDLEIPSFWSQTATNIVVQKYFKGTIGTPQREHSVKQLIGRVATTIAGWGREQSYFATEDDAQAFEAELTHLLVYQKLAFNSPVWFNVGIEKRPQCSACFINSVQDSMDSILTLAKTEGMLFKWGSGTGTNLSPIRSSKEPLSLGGIASGPVSFMKGYDSFAGVIKSGGKTRRAAKMVILNVDHPDMVEFINCKSDEEKKAWALIDAGYNGNFNVKGGAYDSVQFQNANHSVRVTDDFMKSVLDDKEWSTKSIRTGQPVDTYKARNILKMISEGTHICGDPGMQFDTTINDWHTCPNTARINASNPCSEYMFLDDSACNLASLNLMKFRHADGEFDADRFCYAAHISIMAQEIIVDNASYPTKAIEQNSFDYRPLGLGYANLGALLMARGLAYDSDEGRSYTAVITALMHGQAYKTSAQIAQHIGPFAGYAKNREPMLKVIQKHAGAVENINPALVPSNLLSQAKEIWQDTYAIGSDYGYRNSQVTVIAPTGTIGFMMDCDTTGVEPDLALVKYKKLVGGGLIKIVNQTVPEALKKLGYSESEIKEIITYIDKNDTIEGAPHLAENHLSVFDCAFKPMKGKRSIHHMGHVRMMAAVQPFISGAISKTVNLPTQSTVEDIFDTYIQAWKLGLKAVAIYRDGSKRTQPLSTTIDEGKKKEVAPEAATRLSRRRLPDERQAITHKFSVAGHEGYITVGIYEDGTPGEIFITMSKEGSLISGLMDSFSTAISMAFQYGVPLKALTEKFTHQRFEPSGITNHPQIRFAKSIVDYIFRWLALKFSPADQKPVDPEEATMASSNASAPAETLKPESSAKRAFATQTDAPPCHACGEIMVRNGACYKCLNCGETSGCS